MHPVGNRKSLTVESTQNEESCEWQRSILKDRTFCMGMWPQTLDIHPGSEMGKEGLVEEDWLPRVWPANDAVAFGEEGTAHCGIWMTNSGPADGSDMSCVAEK